MVNIYLNHFTDLNYGAYWDDLPETIIVGSKFTQRREEDCAFDPTDGQPTKSISVF
jgi:hypothetical protein